ncbi:hypothetical protein BX667DRAFT_507856 [Coemansia mojavensis]|nr:hypothetical protein BX667DRAFT_507856 [Coemansia mojavensis]
MKSINFSALKLLATKHETGSIGYHRHVATASLANSPSGRYQWTKERDELLVKLVANKGKRTWADIAEQLGIKGDPGKARSRWQVLQPKEHNMWTKSEDQELHQAIKDYIHAGNVFGRYGMWVYVAKQLTTNRSPRQCQSRWNNTLLPLQGKVVECTRFEHVRSWAWQAEEQQRLENAINQIKDVQGSEQEMLLASQKEPWLLPDDPTKGNRIKQFWTYVASQVKTRTPMQCRVKWENSLQARESTGMTIEDAKRLAELVKTYGTKWKLLALNHFPGKQPNKLHSVYCYWKKLESRYNVDLLQIDPFTRLRGYDGYSAWRPTGKDGFYDPNGQLVQIRYQGSRSILLPYVLACKRLAFTRKTH